MEMQYFIRPGEEKKWYAYWKEARMQLPHFVSRKQIEVSRPRKIVHYADAACDVEFQFPFGFKELEGIHSRTDFDLSSHQEVVGQKTSSI